MSKMSDSKMSDTEFWDLVELVNWPELCKTESRPWEKGKEILLTYLTSREMAEEYGDCLGEKTAQLSNAIEAWEKHTDQSLPVSDDGYSDLLNHIVGCGQEEWAKTCTDPRFAMKRAKAFDYKESFSHCAPFPEDYNSPEAKLRVAQKGLEHWMEKAAEDPHYKTAQNEIVRRTKEVAELELKIYGKEPTSEKVQKKVKEIRLTNLKATIQDYKDF